MASVLSGPCGPEQRSAQLRLQALGVQPERRIGTEEHDTVAAGAGAPNDAGLVRGGGLPVRAGAGCRPPAGAEESADFAEIQLSHIQAFRAHHPDGSRARVSQGLVVIPTDTATPTQRARYPHPAFA
ncbi:hypothetical protein GCM10010429_30100 [Micromonospora olivasterospora]